MKQLPKLQSKDLSSATSKKYIQVAWAIIRHPQRNYAYEKVFSRQSEANGYLWCLKVLRTQASIAHGNPKDLDFPNANIKGREKKKTTTPSS